MNHVIKMKRLFSILIAFALVSPVFAQVGEGWTGKTVAEGIKVINGQIRALERKAKETGLSDSEIKTLADLRDDLGLFLRLFAHEAEAKLPDELQEAFKACPADAVKAIEEALASGAASL